MSLSYRMGTSPVIWCNIEDSYDFYRDVGPGACDGRLGCHEVAIRGRFPSFARRTALLSVSPFGAARRMEMRASQGPNTGGVLQQFCARGVSPRIDGIYFISGFRFR